MSIAIDSVTVNNKALINIITEKDHSEKELLAFVDSIAGFAYFGEVQVGFMSAIPVSETGVKDNSPTTLLLENFAILDSYKDLGVEQKMLDWVLSKCPERHLKQCCIAVNEDDGKYLVDVAKEMGFKESNLQFKNIKTGMVLCKAF
ncbi:hypothetical protein DAMA08_036420 [Martiniozyma asiatica (nom. inval.)]|nr:hypothetical protein DAMA08_036420 [Martiniozyma asiatica]